jgi:hypothetical protein
MSRGSPSAASENSSTQSPVTSTTATVIVHPARLADLRPEILPDAIGEVEALRARLLTRLVATAAAEAQPVSKCRVHEPDVLFTASQAAERLAVDRRCIYRKRGNSRSLGGYLRALFVSAEPGWSVGLNQSAETKPQYPSGARNPVGQPVE